MDSPTPPTSKRLEYADPAAAPGLGAHAARGFAWLIGATLLAKVVTVVCTVGTTWYVTPADKGLVATALAVQTFVNLLREMGVLQVVIARHKRFHLWAPAAFWLLLALGVVCMVVTAALAPVVAQLTRRPELLKLLLLLAVVHPIQTLWNIPLARLQLDLRFRALAAVGLIIGPVKDCLQLLLAYFQFHAYSFMLAIVVVSIARTAILWAIAPVRVGSRPRPRRWRYLAVDSSFVGLGWILLTVTNQSDFLLLQFVHGESVNGIYFDASNLTLQVSSVLIANLSPVLFPTMARIKDDPQRLYDAFVRATRMFMVIGVPACILQAALAGPLVLTFFAPRFHPIVPAVHVLSLALAIRLPDVPTTNLLHATGRFRLYFACCALFFVAFWVFAPLAAFASPSATAAVNMSWAMVAFVAVGQPVMMYAALRGHDPRPLRKVAGTFLPPIAVSLLTIAPVTLAAARLPYLKDHLLAQAACIAAVATPLCYGALYLAMPQTCRELWGRLKPLLARLGIRLRFTA